MNDYSPRGTEETALLRAILKQQKKQEYQTFLLILEMLIKKTEIIY